MMFLLGRQAILGQEPPIYLRSTTATRLPCPANVHAATVDPVPPPRITTSKSSGSDCRDDCCAEVLLGVVTKGSSLQQMQSGRKRFGDSRLRVSFRRRALLRCSSRVGGNRMAGKSLEGQVALVTGAGKRIGRSVALRLAAEGAAVIVNYASSKEEAEAVAREIEGGGSRAIAIQADVRKRPEVARMFAAVEKEFGRLDILVNNAGAFFAAKFEELTDEQWDGILDINLKSQFLCAQAAAPIMKRRGRGRIINISSLGGMLPWPSYTHYCVSKAGSIMLTRCLARALAPGR